jgi:GTP-binding protein
VNKIKTEKSKAKPAGPKTQIKFKRGATAGADQGHKTVQNHLGPALGLEFVTSAADLEGCPRDSFPEVAIIGRSNAGKSSLINTLANSKIAKVSSTPGKTRLLNFFKSKTFRLVDMPGYGFAARPEDEQKIWRRMIESYLAIRENLVGLLVVMDIRRDWSDDEENILNWLDPRHLPCAIILTKADKLARAERMKRVEKVKINSGVEFVFPVSALKKEGVVEVEDHVYKNWIATIQSGKKS